MTTTKGADVFHFLPDKIRDNERALAFWLDAFRPTYRRPMSPETSAAVERWKAERAR